MSTKRQLQVAAAQSIAEGWTSGTRHDLTREQAIAEIREITDDPDVLAEAAAVLLVPWAEREVDRASAELLIEAGADLDALQRYADVRRARPAGFSLAALADKANRQQPGPTDR